MHNISGAEFQYPDLSWKEPTGMMANLVAHSGDNKGQLTTLAKAICRDFRQHDEAEEKKLLEWQKQTKGANKDKSERPDGCCPISSIISCPPTVRTTATIMSRLWGRERGRRAGK